MSWEKIFHFLFLEFWRHMQCVSEILTASFDCVKIWKCSFYLRGKPEPKLKLVFWGFPADIPAAALLTCVIFSPSFFEDIWSDSGHLQWAAEVPPRLRGDTRPRRQKETCQVGAALGAQAGITNESCVLHLNNKLFLFNWEKKAILFDIISTFRCPCRHPGRGPCRATRASRCHRMSSGSRN